jgi:hypothetical protein
MKTYMWKELEGYPDWRIQTEDPAMARKLRRHSKWKICGLEDLLIRLRKRGEVLGG